MRTKLARRISRIYSNRRSMRTILARRMSRI
jgi:hypothetical protein